MLEFLGPPWDDSMLGDRERVQLKHVQAPTYEATARPYVEAIGYEA